MVAVHTLSIGVVSYLVARTCIPQTRGVEMLLVLVQMW